MRTPGQVVYQMWEKGLYPNDSSDWDEMALNRREVWETAANAVLEEFGSKPADAIRAFEHRASGIAQWIKDHHLNITTEQKHLDGGSIERAYWHYGYCIALADVLALLKGGRSSELPIPLPPPPSPEEKADTVTIPAGTLIKWQGIPFRLPADTEVIGTQGHLELAAQLDAEKQAKKHTGGPYRFGGASTPE